MKALMRTTAVAVALVLMTAAAATAQGRPGAGRGYGANEGVPGVQLSDAQQQRINQIRAETRREVQRLRTDSSLSMDDRDRQIKDVQARGHENVLNELTDQQRAQFDNWWRNRPQPGPAGPGARPGGPGGRSGMHPGPAGPGPGMGPGTSGMGPGAGMGPGSGMRPGPGGPRPGMGGRGVTGDVPGVTLREEQRNRILSMRQEMWRELDRIQGDNSLTPQEKSDRMADARSRTHNQVLGELDDQQRADFDRWWNNRPAPGAGPKAGAPGGNRPRPNR